MYVCFITPLFCIWSVCLSMFSLSGNYSNNNAKSYPSGRLHKATNFSTLFDTTVLPWNVPLNGCSSNVCYTVSKGTFLYKPHADVGCVGRSAAGYLSQRKRM